MTPRERATGKAALTKAAIRALERLLDDGIEDARDEGIPNVLDKLIIARKAVAVAHRRLEDVALSLADAFGDNPETFSGGSTDDKDRDDDGNP